MRTVVHVVRLLRVQLPLWACALALVALPVLVSVLAIPLRVSVDGVLYLSSARSFFTDDFAETYAWFREPGYPLFLAIVHAFGDAGVLIIIAQALCLGSAAFVGLYCATRALNRPKPGLGVTALVTLFVLNPMYLIYSALVLQQAQFALQLALTALALSWAIRTPNWLSRWVLLAATLVNYVLSVWTSIGWIYLALLPVAAVTAITVWKAVRGWSALQLRRVALPVLGVLGVLAVLGVYRLGLGTYGVWTDIRDLYSVAAQGIPTSVIDTPAGVPGIPPPWYLMPRVLALMHIGTVDAYVYENDLFLNAQLIRGYPHAEWDTAFRALPYSSFASGYFSLQDPVPFLFRPLSVLARFAGPLYSAVYLGSVFALIAFVLRRKWELLAIMILPLYFLCVYAASNSPIDRYGIPGYPLAAVGVAVAAAAVIDRLARRGERRRAALSPGS